MGDASFSPANYRSYQDVVLNNQPALKPAVETGGYTPSPAKRFGGLGPEQFPSIQLSNGQMTTMGIPTAIAADRVINKDGYTYNTYDSSYNANIWVDSLLYKQKVEHRACDYWGGTDFEHFLVDRQYEISAEVFSESKYREIRSKMKFIPQIRLCIDLDNGKPLYCYIKTDTVTMKCFTKDEMDKLFNSLMNITFTIDKKQIECYGQEAEGKKTLYWTTYPFIRRKPVE